MQPIVQKILKMLDAPRAEHRYAAVMVLGHLGLKDASIVKKLAACLHEDDRLLQLYALEALTALKPRRIAAHVAPLLDSKDEEVRLGAAALLASESNQAADEIARELDDGPVARRRELVKIFAQNHDAQTFARLLELLPSEEVGDAVMHTLRAELERMSSAEVQQLQKALLARLKDRKLMSDVEGAARTIRLLGYSRDAKLVPVLQPFTAAKHPLRIRLAALAGLRRPLKAAPNAGKVAVALLELATDAEPHLARAAVETVRPLDLPEGATKQLEPLVRSPHAEVRAFAIEALGRQGDSKAMAVVLDRLASSDPATREAAARVIRRADGAAAGLLKQIEQSPDDAERAERLVRLLVPHVGELKPAARREIVDLAVTSLEQHRAAAHHLVRLARAADAEGYAAALTERATKHRRAKRQDQAFALLKQLDEVGLLSDDDARYAALVCGLQGTAEKKGLARVARTTSPVLKHAVGLVEAGFPLATKFKREASLSPDDLFYVGFNFVESKDEDERDFGGALLAHLAAKSPRSKLGQSAKNKLRLVGLT